MAKIKICGLRREQDIDYANELKPDYIGFILSAGFRRSITPDEARRLKSRLSPEIKAVGVFVNESAEYINAIIADGTIDLVQLHGNEAPELCDKINAPIIKYFNPSCFSKVSEYNVDYYLFDTGTGTGKCFDWSTLPSTDKPFFLAGGINNDNIKKAIEQIKPYCIDLSSAVETDGYKDYNKMKQIMESVKDE